MITFLNTEMMGWRFPADRILIGSIGAEQALLAA